MAERLGRGEPAVGGAEHHLEQLVAGLIHVDLAPRDAGDVDIDVLGHQAHGARIGADLDDRQDRIADDVALPGREEMHGVAARRAKRHHFCRGRRRIHEPQPGPGRRFGLVEHAVDHAFPADLLDVAQRFFLDRSEPAGDIALGRLRLRQVVGLVTVHDFLIAVEHEHEFVAHRGCAAARGDELLAARQLGRLAEHQRRAVRIELVEDVADAGIRAYARGRVGLAAFGRDPQVGQRPLLAAQLGRPVHVLFHLVRGAPYRFQVAVAFDTEKGDLRYRKRRRVSRSSRCRRRHASPNRPRCRSPPPLRRWDSRRCR